MTNATAKNNRAKITSRNSNKPAVTVTTDVAPDTTQPTSQDAAAAMVESSNEHMQNMARGAETVNKLFNESLLASRNTMEAYAEAGNIAIECGNEIFEELVSFANNSVTEHVELSKDFFSCRNATDVIELQSKLAHNAVERTLQESSKLTDMWLSLATKASEPFTERLNDSADRLQEAMK